MEAIEITTVEREGRTCRIAIHRDEDAPDPLQEGAMPTRERACPRMPDAARIRCLSGRGHPITVANSNYFK
ncbi:hypothetical protein [Singulisphaera sp. PoT]|uniref:hypothetical protein n=1 Tax=Singulisphaera sp. PoT TaxID=3411797 RepID=UPI003BF45FCA